MLKNNTLRNKILHIIKNAHIFSVFEIQCIRFLSYILKMLKCFHFSFIIITLYLILLILVCIIFSTLSMYFLFPITLFIFSAFSAAYMLNVLIKLIESLAFEYYWSRQNFKKFLISYLPLVNKLRTLLKNVIVAQFLRVIK